MEELEEKRKKKKAWMVSIGIQVVLLVLFYFLVAWRAPDPPNPEFGIELNFGIQETGGGNIPVTSPEPDEPDEPEEEASQENTQEVQDTDESEVQDEPLETHDNPNPDVVQEEITSSSAQESEEPVETDEPEEEASQPQPAATYSPDRNASQGDKGGSGDQGDPEGDINEDALYGNSGGGENESSLQMSGWEWDSPPEPKDVSDETGKIVFEIVVDSDGYLESYKVLTSTVSPSVKQQYELALEQLTFSKTSSYSSAPSSKGIVTFIIRSR